jgi:hypothetical protein
VNPPAIATTKESVRMLDSHRAAAQAEAALLADSGAAVRVQLHRE